MKILLASTLQPDSIVDGEGIRTVIWTQGCKHKCYGCQNPTTHDFNKGFYEDIEELKKQIKSLKGQTGITFSGGDPMYQPKECLQLAKYIKSLGLDIWCYTGFTYEELLKNEDQKEFLKYIDVLVDGKFKIKEFSLNLQYKGSRNQRIIDVGESLKQNKVVLIEKYIEEKNYKPLYKKQDNIFI